MKYIIRFYPFLLLILSGCAVSTHVPAQSSPTLITGSSSSVIPYDAYRYFKNQMKIPRGCDTTNALRGGKDSLGLMYYDSCNNIVYTRQVVPTNHNAHRWASVSSGSGSVTNFTAGNLTNFASTSVGTSNTTPALTFLLTQAGAHKYFGNNTSSTAAPDYLQPTTVDLSDFPAQATHNGQFLTTNGSALSWATFAGSGTVTSIGVTVPTGLSVSPASITTSGTFAISTTLNGILYGNGSNTIAAASISSPLTYSTGTLAIQVATDGQSGYLSASDHTAFNAKQPLITGAATTVVSSNLTSNRVAISNSSGKLDVSTVTTTDLANMVSNPAFQTVAYSSTIILNGTGGLLNFKTTLTGDATISVSNVVEGKFYTFEVNQDGTGNRHITLPANSIVPIGMGSGTSITLSTGSSAKDILQMQYDGTNYLWSIIKQFQ